MLKKIVFAVFVAVSLAVSVLSCKSDTEAVDKICCSAVTFASKPIEEGVEVTMTTVTEGAKIYYTVDGTEPSSESTEYTKPVEFAKNITLKAVAVKDGIENSQLSIVDVNSEKKAVSIPAGTYTVYHIQHKATDGKTSDLYEMIYDQTEEGKEITEGLGLAEIKKDFKGFTAVSLGATVNQDNTKHSVYVYYNRNTITYIFNTNEEHGKFKDEKTSASVSGLYGAIVQKPSRSSLVPEKGWIFIGWMLEDKSEVPSNFGAEDIDNIYACWIAEKSIAEGFVYVPGYTIVGKKNKNNYAGVFIEGRTVTLSNFYMSQYEVTQDEYKTVMEGQKVTIGEAEYILNAAPSCYKDDAEAEIVKRPVESVTWYDAVYYCNARSEAEKLKPVYNITVKAVSANGHITAADVTLEKGADGYRLPTEAEWEYAARGGDSLAGDWDCTFSGADAASGRAYNSSINEGLDAVGWYYYNNGTGTTGESSVTNSEKGNGTHPVGKKNANALGIYDMSGNVWEWCYDFYGSIDVDKNKKIETDPLGASSGSYRVKRGGSWNNGANLASVFHRNSCSPSFMYSFLGFRLVRSAHLEPSDLTIDYIE